MYCSSNTLVGLRVYCLTLSLHEKKNSNKKTNCFCLSHSSDCNSLVYATITACVLSSPPGFIKMFQMTKKTTINSAELDTDYFDVIRLTLNLL